MSFSSNKRRVTTQDIAERAGVSKATVSYALNGTGSVATETAERILQLAKEMGYQENRLAKATRTGRSQSLGLIVPDLRNPFFPELAQAVVGAASEAGYSILLVDARNSLSEESRGIRRLLEYAIDGLIWCPLTERSFDNLELSCPIITIERPLPNFDCVYADSYKGGRLQAELVMQAGHRKLGVLSGPDRSPVAAMRRQGFYDALTNDIQVVWDIALEYGSKIPSDVATDICAQDVSCVVTANDTLAIGLLRVFQRAGIQVPEQVSIVGFDAIDLSDLVYPPLTTIGLPIPDIGKTALNLLLQRLKDPGIDRQEKVLDVSIVQRNSLLHVV